MKKEFDAVKFQKEIREKLSKKYNSNREVFLRDLKEKYNYLEKPVDRHALQIRQGLQHCR
ncbi:MAG: hypothetical protein V1833_05485 [Elusimicrobiota bacterium]